MNIAISRRAITAVLALALACTLTTPIAHAAGKNPSPDGPAITLPQPNGNPYNLEVGDTVDISNFRRGGDIPICFFHVSCLLFPQVHPRVTEVQETKSGTRFRLNSFGGYMGHPVYKDGHLIGVTQGSVGGLGYGYLFPTEQAAQEAQPDYAPLDKGLGIIEWLRSLIRAVTGGGSSASSIFDPAGVDPREREFVAANPSGWERDGIRYLDRVEWTPGTGTFHVDPAKDAGHASLIDGLGALAGSSKSTGSFDATAAWNEAVSLGVPDVKSLRQQFLCHAQGSAIRHDDWKLELGKPATLKQADQARFACNPPAPAAK